MVGVTICKMHISVYNAPAINFMEIAAFLVGSIWLSSYLDKKSKVGNVAFSILFTFVLAFFVATSDKIAAMLPANSQFTYYLAEFRDAIDSTYSVASIGEIVRVVMASVTVIACIAFVCMVVPQIYRFIAKQIAKVFVRTSVTAGLPSAPLSLSSNVVVPVARFAQTRTYIKLGVLRN